MRQVNRPVDQLHIHDFNLEIYGEPDDGLAESLDNFGLQHPIQVDPDGAILSGARRWTAAKKLGWDTIATVTPDVDYEDETEVQKYILLANAYRKQKTSYVQKKEADAYYRLLNEGKVTKEDLVGIATQKGTRGAAGAPGEKDDEPLRLAASAAGMNQATYKRFRHVDEPEGAEEEIDRARESGAIAPAQASALKRELFRDREKLRKDDIGVRTADNKARGRLRRAKVDHSHTDEQKRVRDANEAAADAHKKGKAFLNALAHLKDKSHGEHLDESHALMLTNLVSEIIEVTQDLGSQKHGNRIDAGDGAEVRIA